MPRRSSRIRLRKSPNCRSSCAVAMTNSRTPEGPWPVSCRSATQRGAAMTTSYAWPPTRTDAQSNGQPRTNVTCSARSTARGRRRRRRDQPSRRRNGATRRDAACNGVIVFSVRIDTVAAEIRRKINNLQKGINWITRSLESPWYQRTFLVKAHLFAPKVRSPLDEGVLAEMGAAVLGMMTAIFGRVRTVRQTAAACVFVGANRRQGPAACASRRAGERPSAATASFHKIPVFPPPWRWFGPEAGPTHAFPIAPHSRTGLAARYTASI